MSFYAVLDLEMCRIPKMAGKGCSGLKTELIQIGAVLLDEAYRITDKFMTYVSPEYGRIDSFIEKLTGIKNSDLSGAPEFEEAIKLFTSWLPEDAFLVTWSESDKAQLERETEAKRLDLPEMEKYSEKWIDCQKTFSKKVENDRCYKLSEALAIADIESDIGEHDALIDAKNTALLFAKMEREENMTFSRYYSAKSTAKAAAYTPFAALLAGMGM